VGPAGKGGASVPTHAGKLRAGCAGVSSSSTAARRDVCRHAVCKQASKHAVGAAHWGQHARKRIPMVLASTVQHAEAACHSIAAASPTADGVP